MKTRGITLSTLADLKVIQRKLAEQAQAQAQQAAEQALMQVQVLREKNLFVLAAGAGLSRIAVGAHWPGDVAVGASLGLLCGLLGNVLLPRIPAYHFQSKAWSLRVVAVLMAVAVFHLVTEELDFTENQPLQWGIAAVAIAYLLAFAMRSAKALRAS